MRSETVADLQCQEILAVGEGGGGFFFSADWCRDVSLPLV